MALPVLADSLQTYLSEVTQYPVIDRADEYKIAVRYFKHKDLDAAHKLVTSNLRFVVKIALEYQNYGMRLADLVQEGNIGLMVAIKKFNPYKGYRLITYAVWWIRSHIQSFILKSWSLVKNGGRELRKKLFSNFRRTEDTISALENKHGKTGQFQTSSKAIEPLYGQDLSLNTTLKDDEGITHLDMLRDASPGQEEIVAEKEENEIVKNNISAALATLRDRERYILENRVMADSPLSLQELGDRLGLTRERVRQIEKDSFSKLRKCLAA